MIQDDDHTTSFQPGENPQDIDHSKYEEEEKMPDDVITTQQTSKNSSQNKQGKNSSELGFPLSMVTCPITNKIMQNPIIVNGRDYEQEAIIKYSMDHDGCDPEGNVIRSMQESTPIVKEMCRRAREVDFK